MSEPRNILLVYVEGYDLNGIAVELERRFHEFVAGRKWHAKQVCLVNQRLPRRPEDEPNDLPQWDLGLNFSLPDRSDPDMSWFEDVHDTVDFLSMLNEKFGRDFVIAVHDHARGFNEDVAYVGSSPPNLNEIMFMINAHRG